MLIRSLLVLLFTGCFAAIGFTVAEIPDSLVGDGLAPIEDFCNRTVQRINDAWLLAEIEFDRAGDDIQEMPERIAEKIKQQTSEAIQKTVDESVDRAMDQAEEKIEEQYRNLQDQYDEHMD